MIRTLTIQRSKWFHKKADLENYTSALLVDGVGPGNVDKMCCLGFFCLKLKATPEDIIGKSLPQDAGLEQIPDGEEWLEFYEAAANVNDSVKLSAREKERRLTTLFKSQGIAVKFVA